MPSEFRKLVVKWFQKQGIHPANHNAMDEDSSLSTIFLGEAKNKMKGYEEAEGIAQNHGEDLRKFWEGIRKARFMVTIEGDHILVYRRAGKNREFALHRKLLPEDPDLFKKLQGWIDKC